MSGKKKEKPGHGPFEALRPLKERMSRKEAESKAPAANGANEARAKGGNPAPPAARTRGGAPEKEDDAVLLRQLFAGVEPLDRTRGRTSGQKPNPRAKPKKLRIGVH